ncbi:MAG: uracil-DNA glycosylase [Anaerolineales bacterium]|jgi:uracil-DNA glycosylase family 4|nr:uracil-DNA glycosylase [Anaerolineales bacterium]
MDTLQTLNQEIIACRRCPRLVAWREQVAREKRKAYHDQEYWGKPVPGFGDPAARVFVVGLAPGAHGSNRTGRQFTGDGSGNFLYPALYRAGFANQPDSRSRDDGLQLTDLYIAAAARCAPPANKPSLEELANCQPYLERELQLIQPKVIVALGRIAFERVLRIFSIRNAGWKFGHGATFSIQPGSLNPQPVDLLCSYHPSRQNTQTGTLTVEMFDSIWAATQNLLES